MQYLSNGTWACGAQCDGTVSIPVCAPDVAGESAEDYRDSPRDACECFCGEFCRRFCPAFCRDFCSDVRDEIIEKKRRKRCGWKRGAGRGKRSRGNVCAAGGSGGFLGCFCRRREGCREVACRTCQWVFCEMGRVCPSNFCRCFAFDFCREFCREFEFVRRLLCECRRGRREICCEGCREICQRICPCVCRRHCCLVPII
jgi:hypothetical protein